MEIREQLVPVEKYGIKCPHEMFAEYITIHNTDNDASAANEIAYMIRNNDKTSFHFAVDDKEVVQGISCSRNAWHAGDGGNGTGNRKSIGIEICYSKSGGARYQKALQNAIELTAQLMHMFYIPASKIVYHQNWDGKYCPHRLLDDGITLDRFRSEVQKKYDELYKEKPTMNKDNTPDAYAKDAINWAVSIGILKGTDGGDYRLHTNITIQDALVLLHRYNQLK